MTGLQGRASRRTRHVARCNGASASPITPATEQARGFGRASEEISRCRGAIRAAGPGDSGRRQGPGARARSSRARRRPISKSFCAAARTSCAACCRAAISAARASRLIVLAAVVDLGLLRLLPRGARRARRGAAVRQVRARGAAGPELPPALSDRDGADAEGAARQQDRHRHAAGRGFAPRQHRCATCRRKA